MASRPESPQGSPAYLSGLLLQDKDVLVVGGGAVAQRRIPRLLQVGARVRVVAPQITDILREQAIRGQLRWEEREFRDGDLDGAWYVIAATGSPAINATVAHGCEVRRTFCVRADAADLGSAWTPATADVDDLTVAVIGRQDPRRSRTVREAVVKALASTPSEEEFPPGTVVLVGGGPGDPGLMTSAGLAAIRGADVIIHDRLGPVELLAEAREGAEILNVGKVPHGPFTPQEEINRLLIDRARQHLRVVRLKGGDNYVFGRGGEEWLECAEAGVPVRVIPGVTSAVAVPALAGIPVTHRTLSQGFCVVGGHVPPGHDRSDVNWQALARSGLTLVILMGVKNLTEIADELVKGGLSPQTPAAVIVEGTTTRQRSLRSDLAHVGHEAAAAGVRPPAIIVVGAVAALELDDKSADGYPSDTARTETTPDPLRINSVGSLMASTGHRA